MFEERLKNVFYAVECDTNSRFYLKKWFEKYYDEKDWHTDIGYRVEVGQFHGHPVCILITFCTIRGRDIAFYEATSPIVNWNMIEEWMRKYCPAFTDSRRCNTGSFFNHCNIDIGKANDADAEERSKRAPVGL